MKKNNDSNKVKIFITHYQTVYMEKYRMTYCGRKNISDNVKITHNKREVSCTVCRKLLGLE